MTQATASAIAVALLLASPARAQLADSAICNIFADGHLACGGLMSRQEADTRIAEDQSVYAAATLVHRDYGPPIVVDSTDARWAEARRYQRFGPPRSETDGAGMASAGYPPVMCVDCGGVAAGPAGAPR
jgi:hypothetical protein